MDLYTILKDESGVLSCVVFLVVMLVGFFSVTRSGGHVDVTPRNKIIGHNSNGQYLVKAKTSWNITGAHVSSKDNLPGHVIQVGKETWVVDRSKSVFRREDAEKIKFEPVDGNWHIQPRGQDKPVSDMMAGFDHQYVQEDD